MTPSYYLLLSALLFSISAVGVLVRRNAIVPCLRNRSWSITGDVHAGGACLAGIDLRAVSATAPGCPSHHGQAWRSPSKPRNVPEDAPDLATQLEDLLHAVWAAEADWRLNDRLDLAARVRWRP